MPSSKTQTTFSSEQDKYERVFKVLGITKEEVEATQKVFHSFETRTDMIKSLDQETHKMSIHEYQAHIINTLNAFSAFGNSPHNLIDALMGSITLHCEEKAKELRNERDKNR